MYATYPHSSARRGATHVRITARQHEKAVPLRYISLLACHSGAKIESRALALHMIEYHFVPKATVGENENDSITSRLGFPRQLLYWMIGDYELAQSYESWKDSKLFRSASQKTLRICLCQFRGMDQGKLEGLRGQLFVPNCLPVFA